MAEEVQFKLAKVRRSSAASFCEFWLTAPQETRTLFSLKVSSSSRGCHRPQTDRVSLRRSQRVAKPIDNASYGDILSRESEFKDDILLLEDGGLQWRFEGDDDLAAHRVAGRRCSNQRELVGADLELAFARRLRHPYDKHGLLVGAERNRPMFVSAPFTTS
jgi:hypothetical protein